MKNKQLTDAAILVVEDNLADIALMKRFFSAEKIHNHFAYATSLHEARHALKERSYDLCLLDVYLPDGEGFDLVADLDMERTTVVMLSGSENMAEVLHAKGLGAAAYIKKPLTKATLDRLVLELRQFSWQLVVGQKNHSPLGGERVGRPP